MWNLLFLSLLYANRLEEAARRSTDMMVNIAQASSLGGICLGAVLIMFGAGGAGKGILIGGILCSLAVFGGPAFIDVLRSLF
tara:strand:+ start:133 stop:378 length:246 start_codon:yes stop_codon:yes gene_type:complete